MVPPDSDVIVHHGVSVDSANSLHNNPTPSHTLETIYKLFVVHLSTSVPTTFHYKLILTGRIQSTTRVALKSSVRAIHLMFVEIFQSGGGPTD